MATTEANGGDVAYWRGVFAGTDPGVNRARRSFARLPAPPRCKICGAPFQGVGRFVTRVFGHQRSTSNPLLCTPCLGTLAEHPGGADIGLSVNGCDPRLLIEKPRITA